MEFNRILIIQTAFIGDVVLATPLIVKLRQYYARASVDFLVRKGNESLIEDDHRVGEILIWDKKGGKNFELFRLIRKVRARKYDLVVNVQRFASTGLLTVLSGAKVKVGFDKNPFSRWFTREISHRIGDGQHEVDRNISLIADLTDDKRVLPQLVLSEGVRQAVKVLQNAPYIVVAPTSVWFTKQFPAEKWISFLDQVDFAGKIYLLGGRADFDACEAIRKATSHQNVLNLCGKLTLLQSTALIAGATMNYVNDSAPLHLATAVNAPVTAIFCSTVPEFGFGPLSSDQRIVEVDHQLACRPCGLHGLSSCPKGHFKCAQDIEIGKLTLQSA